MTKPTLAFIGGTGPEGMGLAQRFARAGHPVVIGSRDAARAQEAATTLRAELPAGADVRGAPNAEAAQAADIVFVVVPYATQRATLESLRAELAGKVVVDAVVPMEFSASGGPRALWVEEGSAAEQAQAILADSRVVGAFHHLSAKKLRQGDAPLDADCLVVAGDAAAKAAVFELVREIAGLRAVDAGGLAGAYQVEVFTAALLAINRIYKTQAGVRIAGLKQDE